MNAKDFDTPQSFFAAIPKTVKENINFRIKLHSILANDSHLQKVYLNIVKEEPKAAFNSALWTYNPQLPAGCRNLPFILWPHQEQAIDDLHKANTEQYDIVVHKSRKEGATELIIKYIVLKWLIEPEFQALVGSEKADKVDRGVSFDSNYNLSGLGNCLYTKLCYAVKTLPDWMKPKILKTYMHLENLSNSSIIDGESTNVNFGVSDRRNLILVDEIGVIEPKIADSIISNLPDVCNCNIYNSTHKWGPAHPYNKLLTGGDIFVSRLMWYDNPTKNQGLYETPSTGIIIIKDIGYWKSRLPWAFEGINAGDEIRLEEWKSQLLNKYPGRKADIENFVFWADGGAEFGKIHSPWFDKEIRRRGTNKRDIYQNIMAEAVGTNESFFTAENLQRTRELFVRKPKHVGDIRWSNDRYGKVDPASCYFDFSLGSGKLSWWGPLKDNRPDQSHAYVLACDPSRGVGAANAVCAIVDANTGEQIGMWVDPNTPEERFADEVWAISCWVGGAGSPFIIWEANNAGAFENRLVWQGARNVYYMHDERAAFRKKRTKRRGWWSNTQSKMDLLSELDVAVGCAAHNETSYKCLKIQDKATIDEMETYIQMPSGNILPSTSLSDSSGASASHGDRVIACALAVLAIQYVRIKHEDVKKELPAHGIGRRIKAHNQMMKMQKDNLRFPYA